MTEAMTLRPSPRARLPRRGQIGLILVGAMATLTLAGPILVGADPVEQDLLGVLEGPSLAHPLGTDHVGRDVLARLAHGAPRSLGLALLCIGAATGVGVALGLVAAWAGGIGDALLMRLADLLLAFPGTLLALLLAGFLGGGIGPLLIGLSLTLWPQFARLTRAIATGVLVEVHVEAAILAGFPARIILARHVLPPVLRQTTVLATLGVGNAIMAVSSLGFLGLGLQPPTPEWGAMVSESLPTLSEAPWPVAAPCIAIVASVLGLTLLGEAWTDQARGTNAV
jgi:ABC-type dipeptide/oligopeptide/nickel transport system permease subunit